MNKAVKKVKKRNAYYFLAIVFAILLIKPAILTIENWRLSKSGQVSKAIVTDKVWESSSYRNSDGFYYRFRIKNVFYEGHSFDKDQKPGDSIAIMYLPDNPSINRPEDFIKRNY